MSHIANEYRKLSLRELLIFGMATLSMLVGLTLLVLGFYAPPEGKIDSGVIYSFGEICIFCGAVFGITFQSVHLFDPTQPQKPAE